jgi:hypothetical protein
MFNITQEFRKLKELASWRLSSLTQIVLSFFLPSRILGLFFSFLQPNSFLVWLDQTNEELFYRFNPFFFFASNYSFYLLERKWTTNRILIKKRMVDQQIIYQMNNSTLHPFKLSLAIILKLIWSIKTIKFISRENNIRKSKL